ncbi:MAG: MFS transporter [Bacteroidota bacterium]
MKKKIITKSIWVLSLVSLFTDVSSEMLYPVMPLFLKSIGFSIVLIGILEGAAEATAGLSKGYFGQLSDKSGKRVPFIRFGYFLSALSKPMMAAFAYPLWIFFARTSDRLGKGIRSSARDAYLSDQTTKNHKGKVFGFHRAFDTIGAFLGPVAALILLYYYPGQYKLLFVLAIFPGIVSILLTFFLKEQKRSPELLPKAKPGVFSFLKFVRTAPFEYKRLVSGLLIFTLFNSSDVFLLLVMKQAGVSDLHLILAYVFYNAIYAIFAYPVGALADKIGLKTMLVVGFVLFAIVYAGFAFNKNFYYFFGLLFLYGMYAACSESIGKAWITNISARSETATAIGTYTAFNSVFIMIASSLAGLVWFLWGSATTMMISAVAVLLVAFYFILLVPEKIPLKNE